MSRSRDVDASAEEEVETTDGGDAAGEAEEGEGLNEVLDPEALKGALEATQEELAAVKSERDELTARLRTVSAAYKKQQDDVAATRKRLERLSAEKEEIRRGEVVSALFDPLQNLRRSKEAMERQGVDEGHTKGLDMVIRQILTAFEKLGMEEVPGKGAKFDPNLHEALTAMPVQDPALDEIIVEVYEAGYRLGSRLIRPARVVVGAYSAPPEPEPEPAEEADAAESEDDGGAEA